MLKLNTTTKFRKDYKRMKKRGMNMKLLEDVIAMLLAENILPEKYKNHELIGNYAGFYECHVMPDWLLVYAIDNDTVTLTASRTGSHSDLF